MVGGVCPENGDSGCGAEVVKLPVAGVGEGADAEVVDGGFACTEYERGAVPVDFVYEAFCQEGGDDGGAALDEEMADSTLVEGVQDGAGVRVVQCTASPAASA